MASPCQCQQTNTTKPAIVISPATTTTSTTTSTTTTTPYVPTDTTKPALVISPATTTTSTTTSTTTTTPYVPTVYHCDKIRTVLAIGNHDLINGTDNCTMGGSNEGFVQDMCNVTTNITDWHKGQQVMLVCDNVDQYMYTPVAVFDTDASTYADTGAQVGIFAGCLHNDTVTTGLRLILEQCDGQGPIFKHIEQGGVGFLEKPDNYYFIN